LGIDINIFRKYQKSDPGSPSIITRGLKLDYDIVEEDNYIIVKTPYNYDYLKEFKETIPYTDRNWDITSKTWIVDKKHFNTVKKLASKYFVNLKELKQQLEPYKATETKSMTIYRPSQEVLKDLPTNQFYGDKIYFGRVLIYIIKDGYYFVPDEANRKTSFLMKYSMKHTLSILHPGRGLDTPPLFTLPVIFKKLKWNAVFDILYDVRKEDLLELMPEQLIALNKAVQLKGISRTEYDKYAVFEDIDLRNPVLVKETLRAIKILV